MNNLEEKKERNVIPLSIIVAGILIAVSILIDIPEKKDTAKSHVQLTEEVTPLDGVELPINWGDLGKQMVNNGTIDEGRMRTLYIQRGFGEDYSKFLDKENIGKVVITQDNSSFLLNLFWALGLSNKNEILDNGEMVDPKYGGARGFASTGGWILAKGDPMDHYSMHHYFDLTPDQQQLVDKVARGIYRPCCGNSTHFPDCNHGMAMLGLLELMASQGVSEESMWKTALAVNSYWFPEMYSKIALYKASQGVDWKQANPKEILGINYSSNRGYSRISALVTEPQPVNQGGGGCAV